MLTGADLLAEVKELGDASKSDLVRGCGYVSTKKDGTDRLNFKVSYGRRGRPVKKPEPSVAAAAASLSSAPWPPAAAGLGLEKALAVAMTHRGCCGGAPRGVPQRSCQRTFRCDAGLTAYCHGHCHHGDLQPGTCPAAKLWRDELADLGLWGQRVSLDLRRAGDLPDAGGRCHGHPRWRGACAVRRR
jgi:hypothetical protein